MVTINDNQDDNVVVFVVCFCVVCSPLLASASRKKVCLKYETSVLYYIV